MEYIRQVLIGIKNVLEVENDRSTAHVNKASYFVKASSFNHILSATNVNVPKQLLNTLYKRKRIKTTITIWDRARSLPLASCAMAAQ